MTKNDALKFIVNEMMSTKPLQLEHHNRMKQLLMN